MQLAPQLIVLHSSESGSFYSIVNAHTGKEVRSGRLGFLVLQVGASCVWCFLFLLLLFGNLYILTVAATHLVVNLLPLFRLHLGLLKTVKINLNKNVA